MSREYSALSFPRVDIMDIGLTRFAGVVRARPQLPDNRQPSSVDNSSPESAVCSNCDSMERTRQRVVHLAKGATNDPSTPAHDRGHADQELVAAYSGRVRPANFSIRALLREVTRRAVA